VSLKVERADTAAQREALYAFRYRVYVEELGMTSEADHDNRRLSDADDEVSVSYAILDRDDAIRGSLRTTYLRDLDNSSALESKFDMQPAIDEFGGGAIMTTSRFILDRELRHGRIVFRLIQAAYSDARRRGARLNYGDCSPHLLPFYEHMGYRRYTRGYNDTAYGFKTPIVMLIGDRQWFDRVRSPIARLAHQAPDDEAARDWFSQTYPEYAELKSAAFNNEDLFFDMLTERVASDPLHKVALLQGLERKEAEQFLREATIVNLEPGDRVINAGQIDDTLYVLLSGIAEVVAPKSTEPALAVLGAGDTFGEIGLLTAVPRTADVIARADCEALVLSSDFMQRFIARAPEIAARILLNLSRELAGRLAWTTERLQGMKVE